MKFTSSSMKGREACRINPNECYCMVGFLPKNFKMSNTSECKHEDNRSINCVQAEGAFSF